MQIKCHYRSDNSVSLNVAIAQHFCMHHSGGGVVEIIIWKCLPRTTVSDVFGGYDAPCTLTFNNSSVISWQSILLTCGTLVCTLSQMRVIFITFGIFKLFLYPLHITGNWASGRHVRRCKFNYHMIAAMTAQGTNKQDNIKHTQYVSYYKINIHCTYLMYLLVSCKFAVPFKIWRPVKTIWILV